MCTTLFTLKCIILFDWSSNTKNFSCHGNSKSLFCFTLSLRVYLYVYIELAMRG